MLTNAQLREKYAKKPPSQAAPTSAAPASTGQNMMSKLGSLPNASEVQKNIILGQLKGVGSTLLSLGRLGQQGLQKATGIAPVGGQEQFQAALEKAKETALKPEGRAQNFGFGTEQIAEFFIPGGAAAKTEKAIQGASLLSKAPRALKSTLSLLGGVGAESATMAGVTAAQGGTPEQIKQNAILGAGGKLLGEAMSVAQKPLSTLFKNSAEKSMSKALGATTKIDKNLTQKVVPGLLDRGVTAMSRKSLLSKTTDFLHASGDAMDDVLKTIPDNAPVNLNSVADKLDDAKAAFMVTGANGKPVIADPQAIAHIEGFQNILKQVGGENAPFASVRKLRQIWDKGVAKAGGFGGKTLNEGSLIEAQKSAADALRAELVKGRPDLQRVNAEFNFWANAQKVIKDTVERTSSQGTSLPKQMSRIAGVATGGLNGLAIAAIGEIAGSTAWRTLSAVTKSKIAKSLATGNLENVILTVTRIVGSQNKK